MLGKLARSAAAELLLIEIEFFELFGFGHQIGGHLFKPKRSPSMRAGAGEADAGLRSFSQIFYQLSNHDQSRQLCANS